MFDWISNVGKCLKPGQVFYVTQRLLAEEKLGRECCVSTSRHSQSDTMAAIAEISSLEEWEEEWEVLEQETQKFKVLRFLCHFLQFYLWSIVISWH